MAGEQSQSMAGTERWDGLNVQGELLERILNRAHMIPAYARGKCNAGADKMNTEA
jgi:hypothetical protein